MTCHDAALAYARRGWRVIPLHSVRQGRCTCAKGASCPTPGKHPLSERWQQHATTDAAQIRRWWHHRAEANLGLATGGGSGFLVVDVDATKGGDETLHALELLRSLRFSVPTDFPSFRPPLGEKSGTKRGSDANG
jgi:Bifunctional DNA primase/polymerase, N-terminal